MNFVTPSGLEKQRFFSLTVSLQKLHLRTTGRYIFYMQLLPRGPATAQTLCLLPGRQKLPWQPQLAQATGPTVVSASKKVLESHDEMCTVGM